MFANMFPVFEQHVLIGFVNFDEFDGHLMTSPQRCAYMPEWTTAIVECASTVGDWEGFYMLTCTGSMWQIGFSTSSLSQSIGVCMTKCRSAWQTAASLSWTVLVVSDCFAHCCQRVYHAIDVICLASGHSPLLDQLFWNSLLDDLRDETEDIYCNHWKHCFLDSINVPSALEVSYNNVLYKMTFYILIYLHDCQCQWDYIWSCMMCMVLFFCDFTSTINNYFKIFVSSKMLISLRESTFVAIFACASNFRCMQIMDY